MEQPIVLRLNELTCPEAPSAPPLTLTLARNECLFIGPLPGAECTGLARSLVGLAPVHAGSVDLFDQDIAQLSRAQWLDLHPRTALIRQTDGLFPAWSVIDNLILSAIQTCRGTRQERRMIEARLNAEADRYGIDAHWLEEPVVRRNRQQRAALSLWRALRSKPGFIVIDDHVPDPALCDKGVDMERMWADALAAKPAVVYLASSRPERLPQAFQTLKPRRARISNTQLEWTGPASPWSQDHAVAARS